MSNQTSDNNKRIAKNTLFLYIRQIFVMVVALYTSRVVLATLGETDYGIYNVVGGIVTLFTFLNFAMGCATNRFITFQLGKKDANGVNVAFSNAVVIHTIIAFVILLLGETLGLYFFETQMNIPENRMYAASWVYQLSIFTCMVNIVSIPYNALITSHEKMNAFAVISIVETLLKLVIVWMLVISYIRPLFIPDYCHKTYYTSSQIYGMLQNMAECLGYDQDVCSMLQNEEYEKVSYRRQLKDNYAFKYGQAALYELYGWLLLNGKLENEYVGTFRTPLVRIDPSFPIVLQKRNLFTVFLLPQRNEDLGNWIKANVSDWQASLIMTKLPNRDGDWILLYGTCYQMMSEKNANIYLEWNSFLVPKDISPDEVDLEFAEFTREYDHAFLEELSWRELINTQTKHTEDNVSILVEYSFSEWNTKRFKYKSFVCLSSEICQMLELTFDVDRLAYTFANEDVSTSFICDDSMFFFLRKDVVDKLLEMKKSYLYIQMEEHRSIIGKLPDTIEEPEIRYNHKVSHKSYSAIPIKNSIGE